MPMICLMPCMTLSTQKPMMTNAIESADVVIVGAGAAGLFAGLFAGRTAPKRKIILLDGAKKIGAKILVAGGGRCNVTHDEVFPEAFAGSSRSAIKKVLRRFDTTQTIAFFQQLGVKLKREETGKLFPVTNKAQTILDALLRAADQAGAVIRCSHRVEQVEVSDGGFRVYGAWGSITTRQLVLATGGKSLPKSGSDGKGYEFAKSLGHQITRRVFPSLVPLCLPARHFICGLSGVTLPTTLSVYTDSNKPIVSFTDSTLCTHFGLSGPCVLDISRYYIDAYLDNPQQTRLVINWLPDETAETVERSLLSARTSVGRCLSEYLPERLARALCIHAQIDPSNPTYQLTRHARKTLVKTVTALSLPVSGNRGFTYAEVTAGGVPLSQIRLETMESRLCPGLYFCGEICDVDGRIGGYNFQWAWASGYVVGISL